MGAGMSHASADDALAPTIPNRESIFNRFSLPHAGHSGFRSTVTNISNGRSQSRHWYSKRGMRVW